VTIAFEHQQPWDAGGFWKSDAMEQHGGPHASLARPPRRVRAEQSGQPRDAEPPGPAFAAAGESDRVSCGGIWASGQLGSLPPRQTAHSSAHTTRTPALGVAASDRFRPKARRAT
jgi:hypothetical protein